MRNRKDWGIEKNSECGMEKNWEVGMRNVSIWDFEFGISDVRYSVILTLKTINKKRDSMEFGSRN
jgi:hypothetical protein